MFDAIKVGAAGWLLSVMLLGGSPASAQHEELLKYIPRSANALVVIDAQSLLNSDMAVKNGWKNKRALRYESRPMGIPPEATKVAVGAQLDAANDLATTWSLAVLSLSERFPMRAIARAEGGYVDSVAGAEAAWTPTGAYFVELADQVLGVMYPANRQFVSRWVRFGLKNTLVEVSDYLSLAASRAGSDTQVVMALDLVDAVQPHGVREALEESEVLAGDAGKIEEVANVLGGLQGITLTIALTDRAQGRIQVDFASAVAPLGTQAKPLFLETLNRFDAYLEDLEHWKVSLLDTSLVLEGELSESGLRRIGSVLEIPSTKFSDLKDSQPAEEGSADYVKASQAYFLAINTLIEDLRNTLSDTRDNHALWMERYGRKVDALPILNVDEQLLAWGAAVAETFRTMAVTERSANVRTGIRKSHVYTGYSYGASYGNTWYGGNDATATGKRKATIRTEEKGRARMERFNSWKEVEDSTSEIRRRMTQKYNAEF